jgi:hypothetical protein
MPDTAASITAPAAPSPSRYRPKIGEICVRVARTRRRRSSFGADSVRSWGSTTRRSNGSRRTAAKNPRRANSRPLKRNCCS